MNSLLPLLPPVTWLRYWWGEIFIRILLVRCISGFQPRNWMELEKTSGLPLAGPISPHDISARLWWGDGDSNRSLLTYWSEQNRLNLRPMSNYFTVTVWKTVEHGLSHIVSCPLCLILLIQSPEIWLANITFRQQKPRYRHVPPLYFLPNIGLCSSTAHSREQTD